MKPTDYSTLLIIRSSMRNVLLICLSVLAFAASGNAQTMRWTYGGGGIFFDGPDAACKAFVDLDHAGNQSKVKNNDNPEIKDCYYLDKNNNNKEEYLSYVYLAIDPNAQAPTPATTPVASPGIPMAKRNACLAGFKHPKTGVPFDLKGYPIFKSLFDVTFPPRLLGSNVTDDRQFRYATGELKKEIATNPGMRGLFTKQQLADIGNGEPCIDDLTWHHYQDGKSVQLVDREEHAKTGHDGGRKNTGGRP